MKRFIKDRQDKHKWDDEDEADFVDALKDELDKVVLFQEAKVGYLVVIIIIYHLTRSIIIRLTDSGHSPSTLPTIYPYYHPYHKLDSRTDRTDLIV